MTREELDKLSAGQVLEMLQGDVDLETVNAIAEKYHGDAMIMRYCLDKGYDPDLVEGDVLKDRSVLFLKYRESLKKTLSSDGTLEEKSAKIAELYDECSSLIGEFFAGDEELKGHFEELFVVGKDIIEIASEQKRRDNLATFNEFFHKRTNWITEDFKKADEEEMRSRIDFDDELIGDVENSYTNYNRTRTEVAQKLRGYQSIIDASDRLWAECEKASEDYEEPELISSMRDKNEKIRRYFELFAKREKSPLLESEQRELDSLIASGIEEIDKVEKAYHEYLTHKSTLDEYINRFNPDKKPRSLDDLPVPIEHKGLKINRDNPYDEQETQIEPDANEPQEEVEVGKTSIGLRIKTSLATFIGGLLGALGIYPLFDLICKIVKGFKERYKEGGERLVKALGLDKQKGDGEEPDNTTEKEETPTLDREQREPIEAKPSPLPARKEDLEGERTVRMSPPSTEHKEVNSLLITNLPSGKEAREALIATIKGHGANVVELGGERSL